MKIIIEGSEEEIAKVISENRIREEWGLLTITPFTEKPKKFDSKDLPKGDTKKIQGVDTKNL